MDTIPRTARQCCTWSTLRTGSRCRFPMSHLTVAHLCGICKNFGHGAVECGHQSQITDLKKHWVHDIFPQHLYCTMQGCSFNWSHHSSAHHCCLCLGNHSKYNCPIMCGKSTCHSISPQENTSLSWSSGIPSLRIECPVCKEINVISSDQKHVHGFTNCEMWIQNNLYFDINLIYMRIVFSCLNIFMNSFMKQNRDQQMWEGHIWFSGFIKFEQIIFIHCKKIKYLSEICRKWITKLFIKKEMI